MEANYLVKENTLIVCLAGEIDHHVAEKLRKDIDGEIDFYRTKDLIFDFSEVEFMDSSGIGVVFGRYKKISGSGGTVKIRNASKLVKQILGMAGVFTLMDYEDTVTE